MISSSEVHDKGDPFHANQLLLNFWSKLYSKSLFPNEWYPCLYLTRGSHARSNRAPLFQSIVSIILIKMMVFIKLLKSIVSIFLSGSINQRLVPRLISLGRVYMHVQNDINNGGKRFGSRHRDERSSSLFPPCHLFASLRGDLCARCSPFTLISLCSIAKSRHSLET